MTDQGFKSRCGIREGDFFLAQLGDGENMEFETLYPIGIGGTGEVWKACEAGRNYFVVIKFFAPVAKDSTDPYQAKLETDQKRIERLRNSFLREYSAIRDAPLGTTPRFLGVHLCGGLPFFFVEYIKGCYSP